MMAAGLYAEGVKNEPRVAHFDTLGTSFPRHRTLKGFHNLLAPANVFNPFRVGEISMFITRGALTVFATLGFGVQPLRGWCIGHLPAIFIHNFDAARIVTVAN